MKFRILVLLSLLLLCLCSCFDLPADDVQQNAGGKTEYIIENELLIEHEYCDLYLKSVSETAEGIAVNFVGKNKTDKIHLWLSAYDQSVNGFMIDAPWELYLDTGEYTELAMLFRYEDLSEYGITAAEELSFGISGFNDDELVEEYLFFVDFRFFPTGNESFVPPVRKLALEEKLLFENDDFLLIAEDLHQKENGDWYLNIYAENKTSQDLYFGLQELSSNGKDIPAKKVSYTAAKKRCKTQLVIPQSQLAEQIPAQIPALQGSFKVWYYDNTQHKNIFVVDSPWKIGY
ncbi:MAG: hypothetical protein IJP33_00985 [Firmicutes bacterium]|nr:hypothetical protein [Bacillota bacterium]